MSYQRNPVSRRLRGGLPAIVLASLLASSAAYSAGPVDGSEAAQLPSGTLAFVSVAGIDELQAQLKKTGLWNLLQKFPQVQPAIDKAWSQFLAEFEQNSPVPFAKVWELLSGRMAFALVDLDIEAVQKGVPPGILFTLDLSGHTATWDAVVVQKLLPMLHEQVSKNGGAHTESDFQGSKLHTFSASGTDAVFAVVHKDRLVIATRKPLLEAYFQGPAGSSLKDDPSYGWVRKQLGDDGYMMLYVDLGKTWQVIRAFAQKQSLSASDQQAFKVIDALGLEGLTGIGYSSSVVKGGVLDRFAVGLAKQPSGIIKLLASIKPAPLSSLALAPADAVIYSGSSIGNFGTLFTEVRKLIEAIIPPTEMADFDQGLAKFKTETGLDLQKDILDKLSGELGLMLALPEIPNALLDNPLIGAMGKLNELHLAIYVGVEDPAALDTHIQALLQKGGVNSTAEQHNGVAYRLVTIPNSPVFPGYAFVGKTLVVGMNVVTLKGAIDLSKGGSGLQSSERYKSAMSMLKVDNGSAISYVDLPGVLQVAGRLAVTYFQKAKAKGETLPFDPDALPKPEEIAALIPAIVSSSSFTPEGMVGQYYSPFGYLPQMLFSSGASAFQKFEQARKDSSYEAPPTSTEGSTAPAEPATPPDQTPADDTHKPSDATTAPPDEAAQAGGDDSETSEAAGDEEAEEEEPVTTASTGASTTASDPTNTTGASTTSSSGTVPASTGPTRARTTPAAPSGWSTANSTETMATYLSSDYQGSVTWFRSSYSAYMNLQTMVDQIKGSASSVANFKVVKEGPLEIGGLKGQELAYEQGDASARQRLRIIYLQDGTNLYTLTMQCAVSKCDSYQKDFDGILAALK